MLSYQLYYSNHKEGLQSSIERSTVQDGVVVVVVMILSIAMIHHKTSGPHYHHFLSKSLVWVKSTAS